MNPELQYPLTRRVVAGLPHSGPPRSQLNEDAWLAKQLETLKVPPRICGGADNNGNYADEDAHLLAKTSHVRRKDERLLELIARCGISPEQIRAWDKQRIAAFCAQAEANSVNDPFRFHATPVTKRRTSRPAGVQAALIG